MSHLPQARWISGVVKINGDCLSGLRVHDAETALEVTVAALGKTLSCHRGRPRYALAPPQPEQRSTVPIPKSGYWYMPISWNSRGCGQCRYRGASQWVNMRANPMLLERLGFRTRCTQG